MCNSDRFFTLRVSPRGALLAVVPCQKARIGVYLGERDFFGVYLGERALLSVYLADRV